MQIQAVVAERVAAAAVATVVDGAAVAVVDGASGFVARVDE